MAVVVWRLETGTHAAPGRINQRRRATRSDGTHTTLSGSRQQPSGRKRQLQIARSAPQRGQGAARHAPHAASWSGGHWRAAPPSGCNAGADVRPVEQRGCCCCLGACLLRGRACCRAPLAANPKHAPRPLHAASAAAASSCLGGLNLGLGLGPAHAFTAVARRCLVVTRPQRAGRVVLRNALRLPACVSCTAVLTCSKQQGSPPAASAASWGHSEEPGQFGCSRG